MHSIDGLTVKWNQRRRQYRYLAKLYTTSFRDENGLKWRSAAQSIIITGSMPLFGEK